MDLVVQDRTAVDERSVGQVAALWQLQMPGALHFRIGRLL
jgi:hypothetical protein